MASEAINASSSAEARELIRKITEENKRYQQQLKERELSSLEAIEDKRAQQQQIELEFKRWEIEYKEVQEMERLILTLMSNASGDDASFKQQKLQIDKLKAELASRKVELDNLNKGLDRDLKREEMRTNKSIAKMNKN